jgi:hypothetical protein
MRPRRPAIHAGMTPEQKWKWAVERLPELAGLEIAPASPGYDRWVAADGTLMLHAASLFGHRLEHVKGYKACTPMLFKLDRDQLLTRLPLDGKPARHDLTGDHVAIQMGIEVKHTVHKGKQEIAGAECSARPLLRQSSKDVIRFDAVESRYRVTCAECEPALVPAGKAGADPAAACQPCPEPVRADQKRLDGLVAERMFLRGFEGGEVFYADRAACQQAAAARWPEPEAVGQVHGFPRHPKMTLVCSQHVMGPPGPKTMEIDWSLYASELAPEVLARWYGARLGKTLVAEKGSWTAKLPDASAPVNILEISAPGGGGPTCGDDAPRSSKTLIRVSTATRR